MGYVCGECGKEHDELQRYFKWFIPKLRRWELRRLRFDSKYTCRIPGRRYFISSELAVPFRTSTDEDPLGFIGWVEVDSESYSRYCQYRRREIFLPHFAGWVSGRLANPIPAIPGSWRTRVRIFVRRGDPTPYIKGFPIQSSIAERIRQGATQQFWHEAAVGTGS